MLSKLFRSTPKWQSPKAQKRIEAIAALSPELDTDGFILTQLARSDSEPWVRREAVARLHDLDTVTQIQKRDLDAGVRDAATQRLQELLAGKGQHCPDVATRCALVARLGNTQTLLYLIREAEPVEVRLAAVSHLQDELCLLEIAQQGSAVTVRQAAAERITTPKMLEELATHARQKDKAVYRIVKTRLDALHENQRLAERQHEKAEALCTSMEAHSRAAMNPLYAARTESLRQQWSELAADAAEPLLAERFHTAWQLATHQIEEIAAAEQRKADSVQAEGELQAAVHILETTLADYQGQADFDAPALAAVMKTQEVRWEVAAALHRPAAALQQRHAQVSAGLARLAALLAEWQQDQPAATAALETLAQDTPDNAEKATAYATLTRLRECYAAYALPLPQLLTQAVAQDTGMALTPTAHEANSASTSNAKLADTTELQRWMDELDGHLDAGRSREATRLWRRLQEKARLAHWHPARMTTLGERMRELKSWAGFAVLPKKEALLANMQALADAHTLDPEDKADRIRNLQAEWKALGVVDSAVEQPLWEQFKAASDAAYEPCRLHFAAQRELRQKNLAQRVALCEQLETYREALSSRPDADLDWKNHDAIMKTARSEWQLLIPVERRDATAVQERFNHVLKALEARLRDHQNAVAAAKQALVVNAQALVNSNDLRAACDSTRQLQAEWKALGQAHPKADRQLWQDFRTACDAVFARREADFNARQQARTEILQQAQALVAALEALAAEEQPARASEAARLEESFSALALPREDAGPLRQRIQQAQKHYETTLREHNAAQQRQRLSTLLEAWRAVAACEQAPDTAPPALDDLPASVRQALQGRLARLGTTAPSDHETQLHTALLDMEIGLDQPSPPGHETARRERLMARLQEKGLRGKQTFDAAAALAALLAIGPLTVAMTEASMPRLEALLKAVPQRDGSRLY